VTGGDGMAFFGDDFRLDAEEGARGRAGLGGDCAGDGRDENGAVSVCHQVSTMGQRLWPIFSRYHIHASGLMGSQRLRGGGASRA